MENGSTKLTDTKKPLLVPTNVALCIHGNTLLIYIYSTIDFQEKSTASKGLSWTKFMVNSSGPSAGKLHSEA